MEEILSKPIVVELISRTSLAVAVLIAVRLE